MPHTPRGTETGLGHLTHSPLVVGSTAPSLSVLSSPTPPSPSSIVRSVVFLFLAACGFLFRFLLSVFVAHQKPFIMMRFAFVAST